MTLRFDTHELIKNLRQSDFNETQAEGLSFAFKTTQESQLENLATKHDIKELELEIDNKLSRLESGFDNKLNQFESGFDNKLNQLESGFDNKLNQLKLEMKTEFKELESEMKSEFKLIKWILAFIVAVTVLPVVRELLY